GQGDPAQPVVAAGEIREVERDEVEELGKREREHREVDAASPQAEKPGHRATRRRHQQTHPEGNPQRADLELRHADAGGVGAETVVGGGPEGQQSRVAVEKIEAEGHEPVREHLGRQRRVRHDERKDGEEDRERNHGMRHDPGRNGTECSHSASPASPKRPLGLTSSTAAITRKMTISASFGAKNVVRLTISPMRSPATTAPGRLPMPPTTTTTKHSMMISTPISA